MEQNGAKWIKCPNFLLHISVAHAFFCGAPISVAHHAGVRHRIILYGVLPSYFCGAPGRVLHRKLKFLWRMDPVRHRKYFFSDNSVAHRKILQVRHRMLKWCATVSLLCGSGRLRPAGYELVNPKRKVMM